MEILAGTSGYSYKEWLGPFYPEKLPADKMLAYYAERLRTVEINNTFYRRPAESILAKWSQEVPDGFAFTLKAPRFITHMRRLKDVESSVAEFFRRAGVLGDRLGVVLFQLPPFLRKDLPLLRDFLSTVPPGQQVAIEFRHTSWMDDEVYTVLRERAVMLCVSDTDKGETSLVPTSDRGYLRMRRLQYGDDDLQAWVERLASQPWKCAYVYFKHEEGGIGPQLARRFDELWRETGNNPPKATPKAPKSAVLRRK